MWIKQWKKMIEIFSGYFHPEKKILDWIMTINRLNTLPQYTLDCIRFAYYITESMFWMQGQKKFISHQP